MQPAPEIRPEGRETSPLQRKLEHIAPYVIGDPMTGAVLAVLLDEEVRSQTQRRDAPDDDAFFSWVALASAAALLALVSFAPLGPPAHDLDPAEHTEAIR